MLLGIGNRRQERTWIARILSANRFVSRPAGLEGLLGSNGMACSCRTAPGPARGHAAALDASERANPARAGHRRVAHLLVVKDSLDRRDDGRGSGAEDFKDLKRVTGRADDVPCRDRRRLISAWAW